MGGSSSSLMDSQNVIEFRQLNNESEDAIEIPEKTENRKLTDKRWLYVFPCTVVVFLPFIIYTLSKSGLPTNKSRDLSVSEDDLNRDLDESRKQNYQRDNVGDVSWGLIFSVTVITIMLNMTALLLFRFATKVIVWGVLYLSLIGLAILTAVFWILHSQAKRGEESGLLFFAIFFTILLIVFVVLLLVFFKKVNLLVILYHETTQCVFDMPLITTIPVVSFFILLVIWILFLFSLVFMLTVAQIHEYNGEKYLEWDFLTKFTVFLSIFLTLWSSQIVAGCQYMTIAGSVATWYFARGRSAPIKTSLWHTVRYHLGSVVLGSLVITLMAVVKAVLQSITRNETIRAFISCCVGNVEEFIKFLSENAYIEIAIHGQPFFRSGRRAARLLLSNLKNVLAISSVGDFVLGMCVLLIFGLSMAIAFEFFRDHSEVVMYIELVITGFICVFVSLCFFGVFKVTIDSLYICYCEDITINNGTTKPYCMSNNLMKFFDETKKFYGDKTYI